MEVAVGVGEMLTGSAVGACGRRGISVPKQKEKQVMGLKGRQSCGGAACQQLWCIRLQGHKGCTSVESLVFQGDNCSADRRQPCSEPAGPEPAAEQIEIDWANPLPQLTGHAKRLGLKAAPCPQSSGLTAGSTPPAGAWKEHSLSCLWATI